MNLYIVNLSAKEITNQTTYDSGMLPDGLFFNSKRQIFAKSEKDAIKKQIAFARRYISPAIKEFDIDCKLIKTFVDF